MLMGLLPLGLLDLLDSMERLVFQVHLDLLEQRDSLGSEDRRATVGRGALQEGDKRAPVFLVGCSLTLVLTPRRLTLLRELRAILDSQAHLARVG